MPPDSPGGPSSDPAPIDINSQLVREAIDRLDPPVTIDQLTDDLLNHAPTGDPDDIEAWGAVHEALYTRILPDLEADGALRFDPDQGLIIRPPSS